MKTAKIKIAAIAVSLVMLMSLAACGVDGAKRAPQLEKSAYSYEIYGGNGLTVNIDLGDSRFEKLSLGDESVDAENYTLSGGALALGKEYLESLGEGTYAFTVATDLGNVEFSVTVTATAPLPGIDDLLGGDYFGVTLGEGNGLVAFPDNVTPESDLNKYLAFKEGNKPLAVNESFTVNFGEDDFWSMRLRPYNDIIRPNSFRESSSAAFAYVQDDFGKGVRMWGDDYFGTDSIKLKGSSFLNSAKYTVEASYRTGTVSGAKYRLRFYNSIIMEMSGSDKIYTKSASFTVPSDLYLTGDHTWYYDCLYVDIDSSVAADITLYSLKLTRTE